MGVYRAAIVTENGQNLIAQALANEKPLIFTSAKTSSYSYPVGTDVPALTGLQDVVQSVLPFDSKVLGGNVAQVSVRFDNDGVDQTYRIETIGLYAKIEGGAETLFSVTQATTPDEMPVQSDISPSAYIYNIQHTVQNASQITLTVNPAGTATVQDIMDIESPEFDDSGTVEGISSFPSFLEAMKSKMNFFQFFRNLKAGLQFVLHAGQIVNNCVTDNVELPLSAAQGKVLKDLYTQLYSDKADLHGVSQLFTGKHFFNCALGINGNSWEQGSIRLMASTNTNENYRAQIGFENSGKNAGVLWLQTDGRLNFTDDKNSTQRIAWVDDIKKINTGTVTKTDYVTAGEIDLRKTGNIVTLSTRTGISLSGTQSPGTTLFMLPEGFRPSSALRTCCALTTGSDQVARELVVDINGSCSLQGAGSGSATRIVFNAAFCAA